LRGSNFGLTGKLHGTKLEKIKFLFVPPVSRVDQRQTKDILRYIMPKSCCAFGECKARCAPIIGDCKYCKAKYCAIHRLPAVHAAARPSAEKSKMITLFAVIEPGAARRAPALSAPLTVTGRTGAHVRRNEGLQGGGFQSQRGKTRERALRRAQGVGRGAHAARSRSILFLMSFGHEGLALAASAASECCT